MLIKKILLSTSACVLLVATAASQAYDCTGLAAYAAGNIATGTKVKHNNIAFECIVGGWCSQGGAYEPGVGWAQQYAWTSLDACSTTGISSSSVTSVASSSKISSSIAKSSSSSSNSSVAGCATAWSSSAVYWKDDVVSHSGMIFKAKWWTQNEAPSKTGGSGVWAFVSDCGAVSSSSAKSSVSSSKSSSSIINSSSSSSVSSSGLKIIGYTPSWSTVESTIQYSKLTHINYAFVLPNDDGSLGNLPSPELLRAIVTNGHAKNVKVVVSVGGWNNGNDSSFVKFAATDAGRTRFTNAVINLVDMYNLDGIDIDWEYPDPGVEADNYSKLMKQLSDAMHSMNKILTAAVVGEGGTGAGVKNEVFGYVDFLNLMAYDKNDGDHSSYAYAQESINYWANRGLPTAKLVLGVPYYARPSWSAYNTKVGQNSANACRDTDGSDYWNGIPTIRKKAQLARNYGGIMTWELSQDTSGSNSLLTAMWEVTTGRASSFVCN